MLRNQSTMEKSQARQLHTIALQTCMVVCMMLADAAANFASACMQSLALQIKTQLTAAKQLMAIMPLLSCVWAHGHIVLVHIRQHEQQRPYRVPI